MKPGTDPRTAPFARPATPELVAVASSTGGAWVLAALLRALRPAPQAVVVAQHLEPGLVGLFAQWLDAASGWRVAVVDEAAPLAAGVVYLPAGGRDLVVERGAARAVARASRFLPCADRLLETAGADAGPRATGLVLSGMGADGAEGLAAIARHGGRALCQDPATAVVASMPEAALRRTPGAQSFAPEALPAALGAQVATVRRTAASART